MQDIDPIYHNKFGISFQWKGGSAKHTGKVQVVFRDTGLLLTREELLQFSRNIKCTQEGNMGCGNCVHNDSCRTLLLETPAPQVSLVINKKELHAIDDLVEGTLFQLQLDHLLGGL
jgi:hypothetical protein